MTEDEIKHELEENERITMQCVCDSLCQYGMRTRVYLADFIASLCGVEKERMFSLCTEIDVAHARGLFFYAYRYMTNESYEKIGRMSQDVYGKKFSPFGVAASISKMCTLIEQQPLWRKRWTIVKRIIKDSSDTFVEPPIPITITVPKNVEVTIKKE